MCVIVSTIVFKCSSVQCHDFLLSFLKFCRRVNHYKATYRVT